MAPSRPDSLCTRLFGSPQTTGENAALRRARRVLKAASRPDLHWGAQRIIFRRTRRYDLNISNKMGTTHTNFGTADAPTATYGPFARVSCLLGGPSQFGLTSEAPGGPVPCSMGPGTTSPSTPSLPEYHIGGRPRQWPRPCVCRDGLARDTTLTTDASADSLRPAPDS